MPVVGVQHRHGTRNAERDARVSVLVLSADWNGPWLQIDGDAKVLHMPEAANGLVDYFRCISGEHPNWEEYPGGHAHSEQVADPNHPDSLGSDRDWGIPGRRGRATRSLSCCKDDIGHHPRGTLSKLATG